MQKRFSSTTSISNTVVNEDVSYNALVRTYAKSQTITIVTVSDGQDDDVLVNDYENFILMDGGADNDSVKSFGNNVAIDM